NVYALMLKDPRGSGLHYGYVLTRTPGKSESFQRSQWAIQKITDRPKELAQAMQHLNHVVSQHGMKFLVDKRATWRNKPASPAQLSYLWRLDSKVSAEAREYGYTAGEVSHLLNWHILKPKIVELRDSYLAEQGELF